MALGLSFVYGITKIFNYAQGAFYTWAGYLAWMLSIKYFQLNYPAVVIITVLLMSLFGFGYEKVVIRPLRRHPKWQMAALIVTLGTALLLDNLAIGLYSTKVRNIPYLMEGTFTLGSVSITKHEVLTLVICLAVVALLILFLEKSRWGMAMQALAQDMTGARIVGIPTGRMYSYAFAIAGGLAGISGILLAPKLLIYPTVGWQVFIKAFAIMVFGGLGSIRGAVAAAFILATIEAFVTYYLGGIWGMPIFVLVLVIMLIFRPRGLFGRW